MIAVLVCSGLVSPARGEEGAALPSNDPGTLSAIAEDVLRRGSIGPNQIAPEFHSPLVTPQPEPLVPGSSQDPVPPIAHMPPGHEGTSVPIPPTTSAPTKALPRTKALPTSGASAYQSNSWRQASPETAHTLSFSSGHLAPSTGLDAALKAQADGLRGQGRQFVYGFLLLRTPPDAALEKTLAGLGVQLLGPHDDHQKARLPIASLEAIAALPDVEWLGVSAPGQKVSPELNKLRGGQGRAAVSPDGGLPIVINLFEADESGAFRRQLEAAGVALGEYDPALHFYRAVATWPVIETITALDFVLFVELIRPTSTGHDQSTPLVDADLIRPGGDFLPRFDGATTTVGLLDTGIWEDHQDLSKGACGLDFTGSPIPGSVFLDDNGHGTHVMGTIAGTGAANSRYRGVAPGVGSLAQLLWIGKIWDANGQGQQAWMESGMDFMAGTCLGVQPHVINISGGAAGVGQTGTDSSSRKLDDKVWTNRQAYVVCSGNTGPGSQTIWSPGVAKNALTVGNVFDNGYLSVGGLNNSSSRGPTGDGRMKPNLVGPGTTVTSAQAGTRNGYVNMSGCSMATPHVTGFAATLMEHYPEFKSNPPLLRAVMMATTIAHNDVTGKSNDYGVGRASEYLAHWARTDAAGWGTNWFWGGVNSSAFQVGDITVPPGTQRLVVVLTWDEPAASAGASRAVTYDIDLWVDANADCTAAKGACGEFASVSSIDNVEYVVVDNPPAGTYRLKASPFNAPSFSLPYGLAATIIRGDPTPPMTASLTAPPNPEVGATFDVRATVDSPSYVASGVQIEPTFIPLGVTLLDVKTTRFDGVTMSFLGTTDALTLGNVVSGLPRSATWTFRADTTGPKFFKMRAWSENGGEVSVTTTPQVVAARPDLVETALTTNPSAPIAAPGGTFSVTDTVANIGRARSDGSTTRYYLSLDPVKSAGATLLDGSHHADGLDPGASNTATKTVTIPTATPPSVYYLIACADDKNNVDESNEANNCLASSTAIVRVTRPDLAATAVAANPPAPVRAPGTTFSVTDTVKNAGAAASGPSTTRYYLSLDAVKNAGDTLLGGTRVIPALAAGATSSGSVTVTIPPATPINTYYLLACADDLNTVAETDETNNCVASATAIVTLTRSDLAATAVTATPPAPVRAPGATFSVTDTVKNAGAVPSGSSTTRYYLSLDAVKNAGDTLLGGTRVVPALAAGATSSGSVTVTVPPNTPINTYFLLACADDLNTVVETDEANNCVASATAIVSVTRPDLADTAVSAPPATKARGTTFQVTDTVQNLGAVAAGTSVTRYYLSLDAVKSASDTLLTGSRSIPALAAGASNSGTVTVTIPAATPPNAYFLVACADASNTVVETDEANNCKASGTAVTVTP